MFPTKFDEIQNSNQLTSQRAMQRELKLERKKRLRSLRVQYRVGRQRGLCARVQLIGAAGAAGPPRFRALPLPSESSLHSLQKSVTSWNGPRFNNSTHLGSPGGGPSETMRARLTVSINIKQPHSIYTTSQRCAA